MSVLVWAMTALLFAVIGFFHWWVVVFISGGLLAVAIRYVPRATINLDVWWYLVIGIAVATALINGLNPGEHLLGGRDSGTYMNTAAWLANNSTLIVDAEIGPLAEIDGVEFEAPGFYERESSPGVLEPQFMHAYPAMLATLIQVGGLSLAYWLNPILGGLLLLALFSLCRRYMSPWAALVAVLTLGSSLVFLYYARTPFTEVLMATLVLSGLGTLGVAEEQSDAKLFLLGGAILGGSVVARVDGVVLMIPVTLYLLARSHAQGANASMYKRARYVMFVVALMGIAESLLISPAYILDRSENVALPLVVVLVLLVGYDIAGLRINRFWRDQVVPNRDRIYWAVVGLTGLLLAYAWFVRPVVAAPSGGVDLSMLQIREALEVEFRSYAELSVLWLTWYQGGAFVVLGFVGTAVHVRRAMSGKSRPPSWLVPLVLATFSLLYIWRPSITPDHIWAMRRFLTVVIPLGALASALAIQFVVDVLRNQGRMRSFQVVAGSSLSLALVVPAAVTSAPVLDVHELEGLSHDMATMCGDLDADTGVVILDYELAQFLVQSFRSYCGVPAGWSNAGSSEVEELLAEAELIGADLVVVSLAGEGVKYLDGAYGRLELTLSRPPSGLTRYPIGISISR